jgi:quercetin dioxygenase-like cupin family protein
LSARQSGTIKLYQILTGNTHTGYRVDLHESELPGGGVPHPPHRHVHGELLFVREGELEVVINGRWTRLAPGSCAYMASNDLHGYRNPGSATAKYFVLALGND